MGEAVTLIPLLIGGATTSRAHTAIKIAPHYEGPVVYVPDASRAVGVVTRLLSIDQSAGYVTEVETEYAAIREQYENRQQGSRVKLEVARSNRYQWNADPAYRPAPPKISGRHLLCQINLADLVPFIDWSPFFQTWDLKGRYPNILQDAVVGETARSLFADAQEMLAKVIQEKWLQANAVFGIYPANAVDDDIEVYTDESRSEVRMVWPNLRQQTKQPAGKNNLCLSDFVAEKGVEDWIGAFAVTAGIGIEKKVTEFEAAGDDYSAIMLKALADRLAEACAEWLHAQVRTNYWAYADDENLDNNALIEEKYRGIRPAPGYPACPDHVVKGELLKLLDADQESGITLTESFALLPAAAVSGFYLAHPESRYFAVGKIDKDQVEDWAKRTSLSVETAERWLKPVLAYD